MDSIPNYRLIEKIHEIRGIVAYQAERCENKAPVLIELIDSAHASPSAVARFKHNYKKIRELDTPGIFRTYDIFDLQDSVAIISEPFFGLPLYSKFTPGGIDTRTFLILAVNLSRILGEIHSHGIIHHAITPDTIFCSKSGFILKLNGFGIYGTLIRMAEEIYDPWIIRHVLPYMAPEQIGKMDSLVDYRVDLYALGVILYELLTGTPPFVSEDPIEIIHAHIARQPLAPVEINPAVPPVLSEIVMKLLSKSIEDRYQGAYGVMADFNLCIRLLDSKGGLTGVVPGQKDRPVGLHAPEKLFGREPSIHALMAAFDRVAGGGNELVLISGQSGMGKSSLVNEIYKLLTARRARFISGSGDQYKRDIPYHPIIQAFAEFARQVLCESDSRVAAWKDRILKAVGINVRLLSDFIPEFEFITGKKPVIAPLGPEETGIRFNYVFKAFVKACASQTHPLIIFVDDLHWADTASLDFLAMLVSSPEISHLMIIGAYCEKKDISSHPLTRAIDEASHYGAVVEKLFLQPLSAEDVNSLIAYTLHANAASTKNFSTIVHKKTNGNPFFIHQFLKILYEKQILYIDPETGFNWDMEKAAEIQVTDNVLDFVSLKISRLPEETIEILQVGACYGSRFPLQAVSACHRKTVDTVVADFAAAMDEGLIYFTGDTGIFCHERIREAVYRLLPEDRKKKTHYAIGMYMLENASDQQREENAIDIVNHFNIAFDRIPPGAEQLQMAELNGRAGTKAMASGAYEAAFHYFQNGIRLLEMSTGSEDPQILWKDHYGLALWLHNSCARAAYLNLDYDRMKQLANRIITHSKSVYDQVDVRITGIHILMAQNRLDKVIRSGLLLMKQLGTAFPRKPGRIHVFAELLKTRLAIKYKKPKDFLNLPMMNDQEIQAKVDVMATITSAAYWTAPNLLPIILFRLMRIFIRHGNTPFSPYVYAGYGLIMCALGNIEKGYAFGQMALSLSAKMKTPMYLSRTLMVVNTFVKHWKEHALNTTEPLMDAFRSGMENGDIEFAGHAMMVCGYTRFLLSTPLDELDTELQSNRDSLNRLGQVSNFNVACIYHQAVLNLKGLNDDPCILIGEAYNEAEMTAVHEKANDRTTLMHLYFNKLVANVIFENITGARRQAVRILTYIDGGAGSLIYPTAFFYQTLARLACFDDAGPAEKRQILRHARRNQNKMAKWAHHSPSNFLHKYYLIEAELARISQKDKEAISYYKKAIDAALENKYLQEAALAGERLAKLYHLRGIIDFAAFYMAQAQRLYARWGAHAKVRQLEDKYAFLLDAVPGKTEDLPAGEGTGGHAFLAGESRLDMNAIMKMSHAISNEIQLEKLLNVLMRIIIENSGAEKAFLILNRKEIFVIDAKADISSGVISVMQSLPVEESPDVSPGIISYVRRTWRPLVLDDAQKERRFTADPHVRQRGVRSVLCMPLIRQQQMIGLIYMENNLTPHAFTPVHLELITLLSTQAVNCIENAIFFQAIVTAENKAQKQLEEYQKLINTMNDGLLITDRRLVISFVNQALCRITGYSGEEIIGRPVSDFVDEENQRKVAEEASNYAQLKRHVFEINGIGKDGRIISMIVSPKPLHNEDGKLTGFLSIVTDVTDLKKAQAEKESAQAQLIQSQKMEAIGTLAGGVAHDFNNYLMIIMGSVDLIELKETLPAALEKHVSNIKSAAYASAALTRQLLAFSRRQRLETTKVDFNAVVADIEKMLRRLIGENIRLTTQLTPGLKPVDADYGQMEQILMNLAVNSRDAMPDGGVLRLKTTGIIIDESYCRQVRYARPGEFACLTVEDTGCGMDRDTMNKIFDPFFSTKAVGHGTGLGLSVVYGVVKQHNGWINVYSEPGQGTTVNIYIPVSEAGDHSTARDKSRSPTFSPHHGNKERILLVEDQPDVRNVVSIALTMHGYLVTEAETLAEARESLEQENMRYDILFSDVILPDGNGIDFADTIKQSYPDIRILLSSGYTEEHARSNKIRQKDFYFLQKPYQIPVMLEAIKKILAL